MMFRIHHSVSFVITLLFFFEAFNANIKSGEYKLNFTAYEISSNDMNKVEHISAITVATDENPGLLNLLNSANTYELMYSVSKMLLEQITSKLGHKLV